MQDRCFECMAKYQHEWYLKNKESRRILRSSQWKNEQKIFRETLQKYKNVPCADCGKKYPTHVMDFDHRNPLEKLKNIGNMKGYSMQTLINEINKCDVVCANCHRIRTYKHLDKK